jgi:hypothetical protein
MPVLVLCFKEKLWKKFVAVNFTPNPLKGARALNFFPIGMRLKYTLELVPILR